MAKAAGNIFLVVLGSSASPNISSQWIQCRLQSPLPIPDGVSRSAAHLGGRNRFLAATTAADSSAISRTRRRVSMDWLSAPRTGDRRRVAPSASRGQLRAVWSVWAGSLLHPRRFPAFEQTGHHPFSLKRNDLRQHAGTDHPTANLGLNDARLVGSDLVPIGVGPLFDFIRQPVDRAPTQARFIAPVTGQVRRIRRKRCKARFMRVFYTAWTVAQGESCDGSVLSATAPDCMSVAEKALFSGLSTDATDATDLSANGGR